MLRRCPLCPASAQRATSSLWRYPGCEAYSSSVGSTGSLRQRLWQAALRCGDLRTRLADLVAVDSWFTIHLLEMNMSFLILPIDEWANSKHTSPAVPMMRSTSSTIVDCAERGVKLSSDFIDTARTDTHFQNVLQIVEEPSSYPNLRSQKRKYNR